MQMVILGLNNLDTSVIQDSEFDNEQYKNIHISITQYETVKDLKHFIIEIFNELLTQYKNKSSNKSNDELMKKIVQYISENYHDYNLSMRLLSEKFSISQSYLSKLLKDYTGKSFMDLVIDTRLEKAEVLLRTTNLKVNQIAALVGYGNASSFVRIFKKYYYINPSEYRNKYILNTDE